jgi:hypothetical protein
LRTILVLVIFWDWTGTSLFFFIPPSNIIFLTINYRPNISCMIWTLKEGSYLYVKIIVVWMSDVLFLIFIIALFNLRVVSLSISSPEVKITIC